MYTSNGDKECEAKVHLVLRLFYYEAQITFLVIK